MSPLARARTLLDGDRRLAWSVFFVLLAAYLATFSGLPENPDAEVEFQTTSALVRKLSFALGGTPEAEAIVSIEHQGRQGFNVRRGGPGREQEFFNWSGIGQALVACPFYVGGLILAQLFPEVEERHESSTHLGVRRSEYFEHMAVGLRNPLLGALTGALIVLAARRAGARRATAGLCGLSYGLCTLAWPQARGTLSDVQATASLFLAFVFAQSTLERLQRDLPARKIALIGFGLALGLAFMTRPVLAPGVAALAAFFAYRAWRTTRPRFPLGILLSAFLPALACLAFFLWANDRRFGDPFETGYGGVVDVDWFVRSPLPGLIGVCVSPGSGLLWFAPGILLIVPWIAHELARGERTLVFLVLGMTLALGIPSVVIPSWHGAWCYGPRYVLPLVPFLWFPLGVVFDLARERVLLRLAALATLVLGFITALGGVLVEYNTSLDLSLQAARLEWPEVPGNGELDQEEQRFVRTKLDWRFAAPWLHWRIFRHRVAGLGETFPVRELFYLERDEVLAPQQEREQGFRHLAWVDLHERLGGPAWPGPALCLVLLALGLLLSIRALDPDEP